VAVVENKEDIMVEKT